MGAGGSGREKVLEGYRLKFTLELNLPLVKFRPINHPGGAWVLLIGEYPLSENNLSKTTVTSRLCHQTQRTQTTAPREVRKSLPRHAFCVPSFPTERSVSK